jgi:hypothetical protein
MRTAEEILALPAGRALDHFVAALLGDREEDGWWVSADGTRYSTGDGGPRPYSTEVGPAWAVVAHLIAAGLNVDVSYHRNYFPGGKWRCWWQPGFTNGGWADGDSACQAVCRAALLAELDAARAG